jgi:carbamoyl-phosphate synthase large subunit
MVLAKLGTPQIVEPELLLLAMNRARFLAIGTLPLVSSPEITATCFDKLATYNFLSRG